MQNEQSIGALQGNPALQRRAQTAVLQAKSDWLDGVVNPLQSELVTYSNGARLTDCPALSRSFDDLAIAQLIVKSLLDPMCQALGHAPLAQVPFRHQYQGGIGILRLLEAGDAALSLVLFEEGELPPQQTICFTDSECVEIVLAGNGTVQMIEIEHEDANCAEIVRQERPLSKGTVLSVSGPAKSRFIDSIQGRIIALRLSRSPKQPRPSREFRLDNGALVHRASGSRQESRQAMALALLGAMERSDAVSTLGEIACELDHPLRWEAIRQGLTVGTEQGFRKLAAVASDPSDPLAAHSEALRAQLIGAYPQLARLEVELCPA